ncbi:MAG: hypothetical protein FWC56_06285 [Phycisphaerae bacterium]|nr:hypothetical protein [Phycisphaerae bacterium]
MSNEYDDLRKKILDDKFSDSADDYGQAELVARFESRRKKLMILNMVGTIVGLFAIVIGFEKLAYASTINVMLVGIMNMLIGFGLMAMIGLWYWITDTHVRIMRETKRLQLLLLDQSDKGRPALQESGESPISTEPPSSAWPTNAKPTSFLQRMNQRISLRTLRRISIVLQIIIAIVAIRHIVDVSHSTNQMTNGDSPTIIEEHTQILEDGTCEILAREQYSYIGIKPLETLVIHSQSRLENPVWSEVRQGVLPYDVEPDGDGWRYTVHLPQPIFRDELVDLRHSSRVQGMVTAQGNKRVYQGNFHWNRPLPPSRTIVAQGTTITRKSITLPANATSESMTPASKISWTDNHQPVLFFVQTLNRKGFRGLRDKVFGNSSDKKDDIRIVYRLPSSSNSAASSQPVE